MSRMSNNRTKLETVIPLSTPYIVCIDPSSFCNLRCNFCYQSNPNDYKKIQGANKIMDLNLYNKIIDELYEFDDKIKVIRLYGFGEPLVNAHFNEMVKKAKMSSKVESVDTTTNGVLLNKESNEELIDSGIDRINISVNGLSSQQYLNFCGKEIRFTSYISAIEDLYLRSRRSNTYIFIKINGDTISEEDEDRFIQLFGPIADEIAIERAMSCWNDFELKNGLKPNEKVGIYGQQLSEVQVCPYVFYSIQVHANGDVSPCFLDWNKKLILGSVQKNSLKQIWDSKIHIQLQKQMLHKKRNELNLCKDCGQLKSGNADNIDEYADILLEKYKDCLR